MFKSIQLQEGGKVPTRVQLLRAGDFNYDGEDLKITPVLLASLKKNFDAKVRGYQDGKLPLDYFHEAERLAAGWIEQLYIENGGTELWADVKWTDSASAKIGSGELRYLSVEFNFDYQDNESGDRHGPTLFGAGLTNRPFIKGMKPVVQFSEKNKGGTSMTLEQTLAKIAELEKMIADMKASQDMSATELAAIKAKAEADKKVAQEAVAAAEKKGSFDKMLAEGKAVEAQRDPFMQGDMAKFAELAKPLNASGSGSSAAGGSGGEKKDGQSAQDQILALAEVIVKEKKISLREAIPQVLKANAELNKQYRKETSVA